jgi:hypothetical protein
LGVHWSPVRSRWRRRVEEDLVLLAHDVVHRERDGGGAAVHHRVHALAVEPLAGDVGADVGPVLVVGEHDLDVEAAVAELGRRLAHAGEFGRAR